MKLLENLKLKGSLLIKISLFGLLASSMVFASVDRFSHLELFAQTLNLIKNNYFKPVPFETLIYGSIKGLLREIDPHSQFLLPEDLEILKDETSGQFYGLGMEVEKKGDSLIVISVIQNSPAQKAGMLSGDKIIQINNQIVKNFTVSEFHHFFKQRKRKKYKIYILRNLQPFVFQIKPGRLNIKSVYFKKIEDHLFYLHIQYFSKKTLFEINDFLRNKQIKGLILDLRGNPGGLFEQSIKVADLFLNEGVIVRHKITTEKKVKEFKAHYSNTLGKFPVVVLIDEYSASASEIVAGALKDHKRAVLIGRKTFGKGSIQNVFYLNNNHALKLTVGEYQTPLGKQIHQKGIKPHIKMPKKPPIKNKESKTAVLKDTELDKAIQVLKKLSYKKQPSTIPL